MQRKTIPGLQNYLAGSDGSIWSIQPGRFGRWKEPHQISIWTDPRGYQHVTLRQSGNKRRYMVHRLVALAFYGDPSPGHVVAHLNGNPSDNRVENISYVTQQENIEHKREHGTLIFGDRSHKARVPEDVCRKILNLAQAGDRSHADIAREFGVSKSFVTNIKNGRFRSYLLKE